MLKLVDVICIISYLFGDLLLFFALLLLISFYKKLNFAKQLDLFEHQNKLLCRIDETLIAIDCRLVDIQNKFNQLGVD